MKDIDQAELGYLLEFIYLGETSVPKGELYYFFYYFYQFFLPKGELERLVELSRDLGIVGLKTALGEEEYKDVHIPMALARKGLKAVKEYRRPIAIKRARAKAERAQADFQPSYNDNQGCNSIDI